MLDKYYFESRFPKLELSYEKIIHNKVHTNLYVLIPYGEKVYIWFTYYKERDICIILTINKYNLITDVKELKINYDRKLSRNTILLGNKFKCNNKEFIAIEDIIYYKGYYLDKKENKYEERLKKINEFFSKDINQEKKQNIIFGVCPIFESFKEVLNEINVLKYKISIIKQINYDDEEFKGYLLNNKIKKEKEIIFKVKADIKDDIYKLYASDGYYSICLINNYNLSVIMNNKFRNIKENKNLDLLEMSDSEEEFENINEDKHVNLKKIIYMKCKYNEFLKRWVPMEEVKYGEKILEKREIKKIELEK
jgi:hypothetical protein